MAVPVIMPKQGQSVESCIITKWHKKKGDRVKAGDLLFTYETDKATFDEEAKVDGVILEIFFEEDEDVPVLTNVCVIGEEGEDYSEFDPRGPQKPTQSAEDTTSKEAQETISVESSSGINLNKTQESAVQDIQPGERIKISPRARNYAEKIGIDYRYATSTGPHGRIIERDIIALQEKGPVFTFAAKDVAMEYQTGIPTEGTGLGGRIRIEDLKKEAEVPVTQQSAEAASSVAAPVHTAAKLPEEHEPEYVEVKLTNIRKVIAKSMHQSLANSAQLTLHTTFDATEILNFRKKIKENKDKLGLQNITINDIILYAVSRTLLNHKYLNAHFLDDKIKLFNVVHLGVAVDTERGLMVPTIMYANKKSLNEISAEVKALVSECQKGTINPDLLKSGTFTVTNLGMLDIESFTPVINPPQTGILGVNNVVQRVREVNGQYEYYPAMGLSLTFDHRAIDGAPAARFLKELKENLENFTLLLTK
ncbi:MAG TPA: 2-oxo acid dehydrogenase subunit E2 [Clostridiaceae bacterium]|nr:2-oxo acid dehydrogenase subunit E2 [Clostridiaceae bacterium]